MYGVVISVPGNNDFVLKTVISFHSRHCDLLCILFPTDLLDVHILKSKT